MITAEDYKIYRNEQQHRLRDLRNNALDTMIRNAYQRYYKKLIQEDKKLPDVLEMAVSEVGKDCFLKAKDEKNRKWFITIGAKDGIDFHAFYRQMKKCIKKEKLCGKGVYVLEQRSQGDEEPYGWHIHWRVEFDNYHSKSVIAQQVYQCFKRYLAGKNYVDLKLWNDNQLEYMDGNKTEDKMSKVEKDRMLRTKYGYPAKVVY